MFEMTTERWVSLFQGANVKDPAQIKVCVMHGPTVHITSEGPMLFVTEEHMAQLNKSWPEIERVLS